MSTSAASIYDSKVAPILQSPKKAQDETRGFIDFNPIDGFRKLLELGFWYSKYMDKFTAWPFGKESAERVKRNYLALAEKLKQKQEGFPFTGIDSDSYSRIKTDEEKYPGYVTPIDELVSRFQTHGIKIAFGREAKSGNVFILPLDSDDIEKDSIAPRQLKITADMDEELMKLVMGDRK